MPRRTASALSLVATSSEISTVTLMHCIVYERPIPRHASTRSQSVAFTPGRFQTLLGGQSCDAWRWSTAPRSVHVQRGAGDQGLGRTQASRGPRDVRCSPSLGLGLSNPLVDPRTGPLDQILGCLVEIGHDAGVKNRMALGRAELLQFCCGPHLLLHAPNLTSFGDRQRSTARRARSARLVGSEAPGKEAGTRVVTSPRSSKSQPMQRLHGAARQ